MSTPVVHTFEVRTPTACVATVQARTREEATAIVRELLPGRTFLRCVTTGLDDPGVEVARAGRSRRGEREWLLRVEGVELHVLERFDCGGARGFWATVPGRGVAGTTVFDVLRCVGYLPPGTSPTWFTDSVDAGTCCCAATGLSPGSAAAR